MNLINSLLALGKRAQGCRYGSCSAQAMGKMQDDSDRMNEQLTETVDRLEEILGEESISEDKAEAMRKQARRSGCMRL